MSKFVLIGGPFEIWDTPQHGDLHLSQCVIGARFEIEDAIAKDAVRKGAAIMPEDLYASFGITPEEEADCPNLRVLPNASAEFKSKWERALAGYHEYRRALLEEVTHVG